MSAQVTSRSRQTGDDVQNSLEKRLRRFVELTSEELSLLDELTVPARMLNAASCLLQGGNRSTDTFIVVEGFAIECRLFPDGGRQIIRLLLASDIFNQNASALHAQQSNFSAQADCQIMAISEQAIEQLMQCPRLAKAWMNANQLDHEALLESVVRLGRKSALARTAHLLSETHYRMILIGLADSDAFAFPLTQQDFSDLLGISTVHVTCRFYRTATWPASSPAGTGQAPPGLP